MSLVVQSQGSSIQYLFLSEAEPVLSWVKLPIIVSILLLARSVVSVSLSVHGGGYRIVGNVGSSHRVNHLLSVFKSSGWHSECLVWVLFYLVWPVIASRVASSKWFSDV